MTLPPPHPSEKSAGKGALIFFFFGGEGGSFEIGCSVRSSLEFWGGDISPSPGHPLFQRSFQNTLTWRFPGFHCNFYTWAPHNLKTPRFHPKPHIPNLPLEGSSAEKGGWEFRGDPREPVLRRSLPQSLAKQGKNPQNPLQTGIFLVVFASP